jgi:hypothetical protein
MSGGKMQYMLLQEDRFTGDIDYFRISSGKIVRLHRGQGRYMVIGTEPHGDYESSLRNNFEVEAYLYKRVDLVPVVLRTSSWCVIVIFRMIKARKPKRQTRQDQYHVRTLVVENGGIFTLESDEMTVYINGDCPDLASINLQYPEIVQAAINEFLADPNHSLDDFLPLQREIFASFRTHD